MDVELALQQITAHLEASRTGDLLPEVTTVSLGDYATPDAAKLHLTVDWVSDSINPNFSQQMTLQQGSSDIALRAYLSNIPDDDTVNAAARAVKKVIADVMRTFRPTGYLCAQVSARYLFPAEKPGYRFTVGVDMRYTVRTFG